MLMLLSSGAPVVCVAYLWIVTIVANTVISIHSKLLINAKPLTVPTPLHRFLWCGPKCSSFFIRFCHRNSKKIARIIDSFRSHFGCNIFISQWHHAIWILIIHTQCLLYIYLRNDENWLPFTLDISHKCLRHPIILVEFKFNVKREKKKKLKTTNQVIWKTNWICLHFATA